MLLGQALSAVVQGHQRLGRKAVREVFALTQQRWHAAVNHPAWAGLRLLSVDGVVWRAPDTPENRERYGCASTCMATPAFPRSAWCIRGVDQPPVGLQCLCGLAQQ